MLNVAQSRYQYTNLTLKTGCQNAKDTLACLRGISAAALQSVNVNFPYPNRPGSPLFTWVPVIDGDMIVENTITMFEQGRFIRVPTVFGCEPYSFFHPSLFRSDCTSVSQRRYKRRHCVRPEHNKYNRSNGNFLQE